MSVYNHLNEVVNLERMQTITIEGSVIDARKMCDDIQQNAFDVFAFSNTKVSITRTSAPEVKSGSKDLQERLKAFNGQPVTTELNEKYARVAVSRYNLKHGTKFRVRETDGRIEVYQDLIDRQFIRQSEYFEWRSNMEEQLETLYQRIRPDAFFPAPVAPPAPFSESKNFGEQRVMIDPVKEDISDETSDKPFSEWQKDNLSKIRDIETLEEAGFVPISDNEIPENIMGQKQKNCADCGSMDWTDPETGLCEKCAEEELARRDAETWFGHDEDIDDEEIEE